MEIRTLDFYTRFQGFCRSHLQPVLPTKIPMRRTRVVSSFCMLHAHSGEESTLPSDPPGTFFHFLPNLDQGGAGGRDDLNSPIRKDANRKRSPAGPL